MRKLTLLLAPTALVLLPLAACENDLTGNGGPSFSIDGSIITFDATTPTFDAPPPEPFVSVIVVDWRGPKAGVRVVFHDASGAVIETKRTGADGKATHTGATPSMASALLEAGNQPHIVTWTGVENGDELHVRDVDSDELLGMYHVTFSSFSDSGANTYLVASPCEPPSFSYGTATELPLYADCARAQNAVLATGRTFSGTVTGHSFKKGNAGVTDGGTAAITLGDWKAPSTLVLSVENLPPSSLFEPRLLEIADGAGLANRYYTTSNSNVTYQTATGFADAYQASISVTDGADSTRVIGKRLPPSASVTLDYANLLPSIESASLDTTNPRRPIVAWTASSTDATDGGLVQLSFHGPQDAFHRWTFVVAPGSNTVTAPDMPAEAERFLPFAPDSGTETEFRNPEVLFVEADMLPSYAAFRKQQGAMLGSPQGLSNFKVPALPADGTYRTTSFGSRP